MREGSEPTVGRLGHGGGCASRDCRGKQNATLPLDVGCDRRRGASSNHGIPFPITKPASTGHHGGTLSQADTAFEARGVWAAPITLAVATTELAETLIPGSAAGPVPRNPMVESLMADPHGGIIGGSPAATDGRSVPATTVRAILLAHRRPVVDAPVLHAGSAGVAAGHHDRPNSLHSHPRDRCYDVLPD